MEPSLGYVYPKEEQPSQNENDYHKPDSLLLFFFYIFSVRSALLMAASQSRRLSSERASVLSPWFFITFGTLQKESCCSGLVLNVNTTTEGTKL